MKQFVNAMGSRALQEGCTVATPRCLQLHQLGDLLSVTGEHVGQKDLRFAFGRCLAGEGARPTRPD